MSELAEFARKLERLRGSQQTKQEELTRSKERVEALQQRRQGAVEALAIVQEASARTQRKMEFHINELVSSALKYVFKDRYEFLIEFVKRNNQTEVDIWVVKNGVKCKPLRSAGGGVCDVVSFALNIALLKIKLDRQGGRKLLITDEPFRNLHGLGKQKRVSNIVKHLSERLGIQIIMVSDVQTINSRADRVFNIKLVDDISTIDIVDLQ